MNAEMIDLYQGVQDRRGKWRVGDPVYGVVAREYGTIFNIRPDGDVDVRFSSGWTMDFCHDDPDLLWIPPIWSKDGRCLWAFLKGVADGRDVKIYDCSCVAVLVENDSDGEWDELGRGGDLPAALLRAIGGRKGE